MVDPINAAAATPVAAPTTLEDKTTATVPATDAGSITTSDKAGNPVEKPVADLTKEVATEEAKPSVFAPIKNGLAKVGNSISKVGNRIAEIAKKIKDAVVNFFRNLFNAIIKLPKNIKTFYKNSKIILKARYNYDPKTAKADLTAARKMLVDPTRPRKARVLAEVKHQNVLKEIKRLPFQNVLKEFMTKGHSVLKSSATPVAAKPVVATTPVAAKPVAETLVAAKPQGWVNYLTRGTVTRFDK